MHRPIIAASACLLATAALSAPPLPPHQTPAGQLILPREEVFQTLGKPYLHAIADFYWIQTSHSVGIAKSAADYRVAYQYGDLVTRIDPEFCYAYQFVGQSIPVNTGARGWQNVDESTAIMERGVKRCPKSGNTRLLLSFNYSHFYQRYIDAAKVLEPMIGQPETVEFIPKLVTRLYAQSGQTDIALEIAQALYETAEYEDERAAYADRIREIELERILQMVERARDQFLRREGRMPADIAELVQKRDLDEVPADPFEGQIYLSPDDHRAHSTAQSSRLEIVIPQHR